MAKALRIDDVRLYTANDPLNPMPGRAAATILYSYGDSPLPIAPMGQGINLDIELANQYADLADQQMSADFMLNTALAMWRRINPSFNNATIIEGKLMTWDTTAPANNVLKVVNA